MTNCSIVDTGIEDVSGNMIVGAKKNPYLETSDWGWQIDFDGLCHTLNELYARYQIPLMVVENELGAFDKIEEDDYIHDQYILRKYIKCMKEALEDGVDLMGYTMCGCTDLVNASTGEMEKHYGFVYVDAGDESKGTFDRYEKDSFYWYKKVISFNGEDLD